MGKRGWPEATQPGGGSPSTGIPAPVCSGPRAACAQLPALPTACVGSMLASWAWAAGCGDPYGQAAGMCKVSRGRPGRLGGRLQLSFLTHWLSCCVGWTAGPARGLGDSGETEVWRQKELTTVHMVASPGGASPVSKPRVAPLCPCANALAAASPCPSTWPAPSPRAGRGPQ